MILSESEVTERMSSPLNLMNRLRNISRQSSNSQIPSIPPTSEEVIQDLEHKLASTSIKSKAANIMIAAMDELKSRIPEVTKAENLAKIAESMSKVVQAESKDNTQRSENQPQFILYAPQFHTEEHYEVIQAKE
jgi:hypothetical protein